ncbi:MAG TPA: hypothetical protein VFG03_14680 [Telluria sp.]|nr:hypothetical protein [Telluria sp.]
MTTANIVDAMATTTNGYDAFGHLLALTDGNGNINRMIYDGFGNLAEEHHADGGIVTSTYNLFGNRLTVRQPDTDKPGVQTDYAYDRLGQLTSTTTDAAADIYVADNRGGDGTNGEMTPSYSNRRLIESYTYDALGRRIKTTDAAGADMVQRFDLAGNLIFTQDARQRNASVSNRSQYDSFHHLTRQTNANGDSMDWKVDSFGRAAEHTELGGHLTTYAYDNAGQLRQQTYGDGTSTIYTYTSAGLIATINNTGTGQLTTYSYDLAGNRLTEQMVYASGFSAPLHALNNTMTYDVQGRLASTRDVDYRLTYQYDKDGNRIQVTTSYQIQLPDTRVLDTTNYADGYDEFGHPHYLTVPGEIKDIVIQAYNTFDSMNRQLIVNGDKAGNTVVYGSIGHAITYDLAGNRTSDTSLGVHISQSGGYYSTGAGAQTERYTYDNLGRLATVTHDDLLIDTRHYDADGRITESGMLSAYIAGNDSMLASMSSAATAIGLNAEGHTYAYDAAGHTTREVIRGLKSGQVNSNLYFAVDMWNTNGGYDNVGNLTGYTLVYKTDTTKYIYNTSYAKFDSYKELAVALRRGSSSAAVESSVTSSYSTNGLRTLITNSKTSTPVHLWSDPNGQVISRIEGSSEAFSMIVNGEVLGIETKTANNILGSAYSGASAPALTAAPSYYTVQSADETLQSVAKAVWGDSNLWYLIADANGLTSPTGLAPAQILKIPTRVNTLHDNQGTFKLYDEGAAVGDTTPAMPSPAAAGGGCGVAGQLIMIAVAVVVTIYTAGVLAGPAAAAASGGTFAAGAAALSGAAAAGAGASLATIATAAAAGAVGSFASQAVGIAIGAQDSFNWSGVAMSALGAGLTAGVGASFSTAAGGLSNTWQAVAGRAVLSNVATQGVAMATGLQNGFNWRGVAAAGAGAAIGSIVTDKLSDSLSSFTSEYARNVAKATISGFAAGTTTAILRGGKVSVQQIATDAFGNALGSSLVDNFRPEVGTQEYNLAARNGEIEAASGRRVVAREMTDFGLPASSLTIPISSEALSKIQELPEFARQPNASDLAVEAFIDGKREWLENSFAGSVTKLPSGTTTGMTIKRNEYSLEVSNAVKKMIDIDPSGVLITKELKTLAALAYGEASVLNDPAEIGAIANVVKRQADARNESIDQFIAKEPSYAFAADGSNERYNNIINSSTEELLKNKNYSLALKGAINALDPSGYDFSDGAYFWDGRDIQTNYANHPKVNAGIHFSDASDNIYDIKETSFPKTEYYYNNGKATKIRGTYDHKYDSTAAYGQTVFWKYNSDFINATGNKAYK